MTHPTVDMETPRVAVASCLRARRGSRVGSSQRHAPLGRHQGPGGLALSSGDRQAFPHRGARARRLRGADARPRHRDRRASNPASSNSISGAAKSSRSSRRSPTCRTTASTMGMWGRTAISISAPWTTTRQSPTGSFWRWDGHELLRFRDGIVVTNGPAFSPDGRIDLHHRHVGAHDPRAGSRARRARASHVSSRGSTKAAGNPGRNLRRRRGPYLGLPLGRLAHHAAGARRERRADRADAYGTGHQMRVRRERT